MIHVESGCWLESLVFSVLFVLMKVNSKELAELLPKIGYFPTITLNGKSNKWQTDLSFHLFLFLCPVSMENRIWWVENTTAGSITWPPQLCCFSEASLIVVTLRTAAVNISVIVIAILRTRFEGKTPNLVWCSPERMGRLPNFLSVLD